jgi:hypothetical protein
VNRAPGLVLRPQCGLHLPGGNIPRPPGDLPHPGRGLSALRGMSDRTKLLTKSEWREIGLIGAEGELLRYATLRSRNSGRKCVARCNFFSKFTCGKLIVKKDEKQTISSY